MVKPLVYMLLFLSLSLFATDAVAAVMTSSPHTSCEVPQIGERSERVKHAPDERSMPPVWRCVAVEVSVPSAPNANECQKSLPRQNTACNCGRTRFESDHSASRGLPNDARGALSSDFYVVAYRKIVI